MRRWNFYTAAEIKPAGWLKRQLEIQAQGLSGNLDKIWPDIKESAWIGGDKEGWERVPYWLDGFVPLAYLLENEDMIRRAKKYIDAIIAAQKEDGWICPCKEKEIKDYDTWAVILISKVLTVYYECSKDERIPQVVYKVLKNYFELLKNGHIKLFNWGEFRWFEAFIAISFTYQRFPEEWLLELARILKEQGADYRKFIGSWKKPKNIWQYKTHIVNIVMMLKYEALSCDLLKEDYCNAAEDLISILGEYNGTPTGLFTGDECLSGISPIQGTELCAVVEQMYSYEHLFSYTGENKWAERLEMLSFNALPATISDDMWTHQYVQMSNQIACKKTGLKSIFRTVNSEAHIFGLEPNFGCCTANFNQGWPKFILSAFMHNGSEIINAVPVPSELKTEDVCIKLETNYPFENSFTYTIDTKKDFSFIIRIPSFAKNLRLNGKAVKTSDLCLSVKSGEKQEVHIEYDVSPCFEKRPNGLYTVKCGSLVFSIPVKYEKIPIEYEKNGVQRKYPYCDYEYIPVSEWGYAYSSDELDVCFAGIAEIPFSSENPPTVIKAKVKRIDWGYKRGFSSVCSKLPKSTVPISDEEDILLYPYGCSKLRMTEIPFIK